jgi:transposase InsO family protein
LARESALVQRHKLAPKSVEERDLLIRKAHDAGHSGVQSIFMSLWHAGYWWSQIRNDIQTIIGQCLPCQRNTLSKEGFHLTKGVTATYPMDMIQMDLITGLPTSDSGHTNILTIIDLATSYTWVIPLKTKTMLEVARHLMVIKYQFGQAKIIHTDNGSEFRNSLMTNITDLAKIDIRFSTAYYPQGHGTVGRRNRDISESLRKMASAAMNNWPAHCSYLDYSLNTRINKATNSSPFSLMFGREPNGYEDYRKCPLTQEFNKVAWEHHLAKLNKLVHPSIKKRVDLVKEFQNQLLDTKRKILICNIGDLVMVKDVTRSNKWDAKCEGPFTISHITKANTYQVKDKTNSVLPFTFPANHIRLVPNREIIQCQKDPRTFLSTTKWFRLSGII